MQALQSVSAPSGLLKIPFSMSVSGCLGCGKSYFVKNLLLNQHKFVEGQWDKIFYISRYQLPNLERDLTSKLKNIEFIQGEIPTLEQLQPRYNPGDQILLVVDDLMEAAANSRDV